MQTKPSEIRDESEDLFEYWVRKVTLASEEYDLENEKRKQLRMARKQQQKPGGT